MITTVFFSFENSLLLKLKNTEKCQNFRLLNFFFFFFFERFLCRPIRVAVQFQRPLPKTTIILNMRRKLTRHLKIPQNVNYDHVLFSRVSTSCFEFSFPELQVCYIYTWFNRCLGKNY